MNDPDSSIQYRPRTIACSRDSVGVAVKKAKCKQKAPCYISIGEKHIAYNSTRKTYKVNFNRRTMSFTKDGFLTLGEAIRFRDEQLAVAPAKELGRKKKITNQLQESPIGV